MLTKRYGRQAQDLPVPAAIPKPIIERFRQMEDLLLDMRHQQDVLLKRLAATQAQLDGLTRLSPSAAHPNGPFTLRQRQ